MRKITNPERGCGHLKRGKAYVRGVVGSPDGVLPSFVQADPFIPFREMGTDDSFTRSFQTFNGHAFEVATEGDLADFRRLYPGEAADETAVDNYADRGIDTTVNEPEWQRYMKRLRHRGPDGDHFGEIQAGQQVDLIMRAGKTHYDDPHDFIQEAVDLGISKAIPLSKRQDPPEIEPGITRLWVVHPDTHVGWAVIGYAYLQEVVYTLPEDGNVPAHVQDEADKGNLNIVDIEPPKAHEDDSGLSDFVDDEDGGDGSAADDDREEPDDADATPGDDDAETVVASDRDDRDVEVASPEENRLRIEWQDWYDDAKPNDRYNLLKTTAADHDVDVSPQPTADELMDALAEAEVAPHGVDAIWEGVQ